MPKHVGGVCGISRDRDRRWFRSCGAQFVGLVFACTSFRRRLSFRSLTASKPSSYNSALKLELPHPMTRIRSARRNVRCTSFRRSSYSPYLQARYHGAHHEDTNNLYLQLPRARVARSSWFMIHSLEQRDLSAASQSTHFFR